ncbi:DNA-directed RNA polymerases I and III subunit RPAC1 [Enteropsectra breve]|nr:DNA-directed RNA polymerases I and III subunit RPAC1 [Enteropsectra breve]
MYLVEEQGISKTVESTDICIEEYIKSMHFKLVSREEPGVLEIDLINCHASIANALRRILIAEIPSVAFHNVTVYENNTVFPDEYIAHRIGLIPLTFHHPSNPYFLDENEQLKVEDFILQVKNESKERMNVYSEHIKYEGEVNEFSISIKPGVLICKLAPGHMIEMKLSVTRGTGKEHAKWSPVSLCSYRLMPKIVLEKNFIGEDAEELQKCFSPGVIDISKGYAEVVCPRLDSMSRNVFRNPKFKDCVKIMRETSWFCFTIESIAEDPLSLLRRAVRKFKANCEKLRLELAEAASKISE